MADSEQARKDRRKKLLEKISQKEKKKEDTDSGYTADFHPDTVKQEPKVEPVHQNVVPNTNETNTKIISEEVKPNTIEANPSSQPISNKPADPIVDETHPLLERREEKPAIKKEEEKSIDIKETNEKNKQLAVLKKREYIIRSIMAMIFGIYLFVADTYKFAGLKEFSTKQMSIFLQFVLADIAFIIIYRRYLNQKKAELTTLLKTGNPEPNKGIMNLLSYASKVISALV